MPTLLQINTVVNKSSTGHIAEEIGQLAINNGWKSYIAYGRYERPSKSTLIKIGNDFDVKLHGLQTRLFDRHGLASKNATKKLIEQIKKIQPDVIHLHNLHGYYVNIEILFNFLTIENIPVVWTLHDCWPITGHCSHFDYVGCEKWKTECYSCPQKKMYPASFLFDNSRQNYSLKKQLFTSVKDMALVPVSNWMADILKQSFLQKYPIEIIHNGINLSQFKPANGEHIKNKYQLENKFIILGVASVWKERKGLKDFVELSISLDKNFQIVLVGLSAHQIKSLPENIIGINKTENVEELVRIYSIADVFVNPTWEDTFPTTNVESLACGTPVITYKTGGSPEAIDATVGIVVEKGNINGLVQAVKHVQKRGNKYYTNACVERVRQFYNKDDQYKDYLNLYNKLLHND